MKSKHNIIVLIAGMAAILLSSSCGLVNKMAEPANQFFSHVARGDMKTAYESTAGIFKSSTSYEQFEAFMTGYDLDKYKSANWSSVSYKNDTGVIKGSIVTTGGTTIPLDIQLVKEGDTWKISHISLTGGGVTSSPAKEKPLSSGKQVPPMSELNRLSSQAVVLMGKCINSGNYQPFYNSISKVWQSQITVDTFSKEFHIFKDKGVDLTIVDNVEPVFNEAPVIENGNLLLRGVFPTKPYAVHFDLTFTYEYPEWKLFGINVNAK